jgi:hypothetical protein
MTGSRTSDGAVSRYALYGIVLETAFPFANRMAPAEAPADLRFIRRHAPAPDTGLNDAVPAFAAAADDDPDDPALEIYVRDAGTDAESVIVRFTRSAEYHLTRDCILCHAPDPALDYLVEIQLLGHVLALWLEWRGRLAIHASAVVTGAGALGFLASNKGGKSSLAAALMQAGCPLLTDDILTLAAVSGAVRGQAAFPSMRMWPEQAAHFLGSAEALDIVHPAFAKRRFPVGPGGFGRFHAGDTAMAGLCIPTMHDDPARGVVFEPLPPKTLFLQLLQHSFVARPVAALGWQARRMPLLGQASTAIPGYVLHYPRGLDRLPDVARAILDRITA